MARLTAGMPICRPGHEKEMWKRYNELNRPTPLWVIFLLLLLFEGILISLLFVFPNN